MSKPEKTETYTLIKSTPDKISSQMLSLIARRLYNEAKGLGWGGQVHFIVSDSHSHVDMWIEYEANAGFNVGYYQKMFVKYMKELEPYFTKK